MRSRTINYESNSNNKYLAIGDAFALSLLLFFAAKNPNATQALERNMILSANLQPVFEGSQAVADALLPVMLDLGVNCDLVGIQEGIQPCGERPQS
mmetsp:Transcript_2286/g.4163  ORF Transcript_2286/g.4163 Transcript_2286/m.4163 type:complete len:96 (-) Transcript_2286:77-364(-)